MTLRIRDEALDFSAEIASAPLLGCGNGAQNSGLRTLLTNSFESGNSGATPNAEVTNSIVERHTNLFATLSSR